MTASVPIKADDPFLTECVNAFQRRSKTLKHRNASVDFERIIEIEGGVRCERIEFIVRKSRRQTLRITLWQDRRIWIDARESLPKAGWKFEFVSSGRLTGDVNGRELVAAAEGSLLAMSPVVERKLASLEAVWTPLVAKGPKAI